MSHRPQRLEDGPHPLEVPVGRPDEDVELSFDRLRDAATDRSIHQDHTVRQSGGHPANGLRPDGGHVDEDPPRAHRPPDPVFSQDDLLERLRRGQHGEGDLSAGTGPRRRRGHHGPALGDRRGSLRRAVPDGQIVPGIEQARGHGGAHLPQPQKCDLRHVSALTFLRGWARQE